MGSVNSFCGDIKEFAQIAYATINLRMGFPQTSRHFLADFNHRGGIVAALIQNDVDLSVSIGW